MPIKSNFYELNLVFFLGFNDWIGINNGQSIESKMPFQERKDTPAY
jgi:hypothetical protein